MKKFKDILFEPDEYDGVTWHDVIVACFLTSSAITGITTLIHIFC